MHPSTQPQKTDSMNIVSLLSSRGVSLDVGVSSGHIVKRRHIDIRDLAVLVIDFHAKTVSRDSPRSPECFAMQVRAFLVAQTGRAEKAVPGHDRTSLGDGGALRDFLVDDLGVRFPPPGSG